jgi:hypothetical protein
VRTSGAVRFSGFFPAEPALFAAVPDLVPDVFELSTQRPVNLKHTGSFLLPAAGGPLELVLLEADAEEPGADEAGAEEDCVVAAAGASWAWATGIAATIAAATAAVTKPAAMSLVRASPAAL